MSYSVTVLFYCEQTFDRFCYTCRELQRVSRDAAAAFHELQSLRESVSVRASADTSARNSKSASDGLALRLSPILIPSSSPSRNKKMGSSNEATVSALYEIDETIDHYKKYCSSLAESVFSSQVFQGTVTTNMK